jgi:DNA polymerase III delta prime subunit
MSSPNPNDANDRNDAKTRLSERILNWEPSDWHELLLEDLCLQACKQMPEDIRLRRSYKPTDLLITGPQNTGKMTIANFLARSACCRNRSLLAVCGRCATCRFPSYPPDYKKLEKEWIDYRNAERAKLNSKPKRKKAKGETVEIEQGKGNQDEEKTFHPGRDVVKEALPDPLYIRLSGPQLTRDGLEGVFRRTSHIKQFRVVVVEDLDHVPKALQPNLYVEFMDRLHGISKGRVFWICTATSDHELDPNVNGFLTLGIETTNPSVDVLNSFLSGRCSDWGIVYKPSQIARLAERLQETALIGRIGVIALAKKVLAHIVTNGAAVTDELVDEGLIVSPASPTE